MPTRWSVASPGSTCSWPCGSARDSRPRAFLSDHPIVGLRVSLTDAQWARIEPLLPDRTPRRGGRWRDHRLVIDAIAFKYRTGTPWMDLPERFGWWKVVHNRLRKWAVDGTWEKVFIALPAQADTEGDLDWVVAVDSTIVRAHQHAAGARQKGPRPANGPEEDQECPVLKTRTWRRAVSRTVAARR
ncbi:IS5 family transposase [Streptomyces sp. ID05-47C]|uniref:IS5 family transposase n=1 Tax=Streptomyces sp. ID05-47C TaxID=3028665 RepID=UPI0029BB22D6|nr:IS5 family transposase [Streptomyces sp. ID05-47C]MDX3568545.1 IS5 family transposase [Streptomyces sp. ID05-47C]